MLFGRSRCATNRTSGLSMPMPNAIVATMISESSTRNRRWCSRARLGRQAGVIRQRGEPLLHEPLGDALRLVARQAVDDARLAAMVAAGTRAAAAARRSSPARRSGCSAGRSCSTNTRGASSSSRATISARVGSVAVAVSAMRGTPGNHCLSTFKPRYSARKSWPHCDTQCASSIAMIETGHFAQQRLRLLLEQPLRREIEQLEAAVPQIGDDVALLGAAQRRVQERGRHARFAQRAHLILHQRDQRRHDDADAVAHERRDLIAQRLAAARRHQHERVVARPTAAAMIASCWPRNSA